MDATHLSTTAPHQRLAALRTNLILPVVASPMFLVSNTDMTIEMCKSGIVGSFPALNARPQEEFGRWLERMENALDAFRAGGGNPAPYAINLTLRKNNPRQAADIETCVKHKVPIILTSLSAPDDVVKRVHAYGGLVFHDVTTVRHAKRAIVAGVDGLILVCAGAGGHGGILNPFAFLAEVRSFYDGPIILAGAISTGTQVFAAQVMGADLVYMGTRFIATQESGAVEEYKDMLVASQASDIVYTPYFSGTPANYLAPSIARAGLDPDEVRQNNADAIGNSVERHLRWKDIWGAGQGVGQIIDLPKVSGLVSRLGEEYRQARASWAKRLSSEG